jgi:hypothetical protein
MPFGHAPGGEVEVLQHARARPVDVGAVLEDDVDEGRAEEGKAAHHLRLRHRQHGRGQRVGDLVFHHLRRLPGVFGVDDDLHVREVGQGVDGRSQHGKDAPDNVMNSVASSTRKRFRPDQSMMWESMVSPAQ